MRGVLARQPGERAQRCPPAHAPRRAHAETCNAGSGRLPTSSARRSKPPGSVILTGCAALTRTFRRAPVGSAPCLQEQRGICERRNQAAGVATSSGEGDENSIDWSEQTQYSLCKELDCLLQHVIKACSLNVNHNGRSSLRDVQPLREVQAFRILHCTTTALMRRCKDLKQRFGNAPMPYMSSSLL